MDCKFLSTKLFLSRIKLLILTLLCLDMEFTLESFGVHVSLGYNNVFKGISMVFQTTKGLGFDQCV